MKIHLISNDRTIQTLCQETIGETLQQGWTLQFSRDATPDIEADVCVWDVRPEELPLNVPNSADRWRHLFLVHRSDVQRLREVMPFSDLQIVLKPVTRAALSAFVSDMCERCSETSAASEVSIQSLRADRDAILQCLMQTNLKLQEYDQDRTNFLARAIHDFRAPLTAVTGYCSILLSEDLGSLTEDQREVLVRIQRSAKKLSRMASAMFQLSIAPQREITAELQRGELRDCIETAVNEIIPTAEEKRLSIAVDTAPSPEPLFFERLTLEQVIMNLLDNACKFAPRGSSIEIRGYPYFWEQGIPRERFLNTIESARRKSEDHRPNSYRVDIRDSGPGVPVSHLEKIFEEYTSYSGGSDRSGGGLGLAICRMILNRHNGRIWAESTSHGTAFSFVLPYHHRKSELPASPVTTLAQQPGVY